ncbi:MAG: hypothetical protein QOE09_2199 [Ilumatobacteraceae bacterium]|jgi:hypothetical protein
MKLRSKSDDRAEQIAALHARVHPPEPTLDERIEHALADRDAKAKAAARAAAIAAVFTTPCHYCGDARRTEDFGRSRVGACASCNWHLDRNFMSPDGRRDYAVMMLLTGMQQSPLGLGKQLGLHFWFELPPNERPTKAIRPFSWISDETLADWRRRIGMGPHSPRPVEPRPPKQRPARKAYRRPERPVDTPADPVAVAAAHRARW